MCLISFFYVWTSSFPKTIVEETDFFPNVNFLGLCQVSDGFNYVCSCQDLLFCSLSPHVELWVKTMLACLSVFCLLLSLYNIA